MRILLRRYGGRTASELAESADTAGEDEGLLRLSFKDCVGCPEMGVVPASSFTMGPPSSEKARFHNEDARHRVTIAAPFAVGDRRCRSPR